MEFQPYHECPQFQFCDANRCPLATNLAELDYVAGDAKCKLGKTRRRRIAKKYPDLIPWRGLWPRELQGLQRWEALPEAEKEAMRERGKALSSKHPPKTRLNPV